MTGNPVCLVNRTDAPLAFTADGRHYVLEPGENHGFVEAHTRFALAQNPLNGTEDYATLEFQSKVGVKGNPAYPVTPLTDEELLTAMDSVERFDRRTIGGREGAKAERSRFAPPRGRAGVSTTMGAELGVGG